MRFSLMIILLFAFLSAAQSQLAVPAGWQEIDADGLFTFRMPSGFVKTDMAGVENYLGEYFKGETRFLFVWKDTASYEYDERFMRDVSEVATIIDGKRGTIRTFSTTRYGKPEYIAELNVGNWRDNKVELYMSIESKNQADLETAKQIFRSVRFSKGGKKKE